MAAADTRNRRIATHTIVITRLDRPIGIGTMARAMERVAQAMTAA
jgi:hypothetical protein